jgi:L-2,4-diaminobutyrate decarboxylase
VNIPASATGGPLFLSGDEAATRRLGNLAATVVATLGRSVGEAGPCPDLSPETLAQLVATIDPCPPDGVDFDQVMAEMGHTVLAQGVHPTHPRTVAHLHSPTLLTAAVSELAIGATNQSLDSYDQAPAATLVEDHLVRWLAARLGLPATASGVLTAGGTASNLLGLLLARDAAGAFGDTDIAADGLPPEAATWRIVTSEAAHFSVARAAATLGLGRRHVVTVATDERGRMDVDALDTTLAELGRTGLRPIAVVGTAGTTDTGAIDPLADLAASAAAAGAWFHVDAAVGSGLCLSERLRPRLTGIERADSITADMHKLWWQPIGASALLVRDERRLSVLRCPSDYLDRADDDGDGHLNLVSRSLDTSRRFDALKVLVSLRSTGRRRLAAMVEHLVDLATASADMLGRRPEIELLAPPSTVMVLFRWRPGDGLPGPDEGLLDAANTAIQRRLFASGRAVVGRTRLRGRVALKFTLVNPSLTLDDLSEIADEIAAEGAAWLAAARASGDPLELAR